MLTGRMAGAGRNRLFLPLFLPLLVLSAAVFAWQASYFDFVVDDAFIPLRYAENLLAGNGMVFNPGERVEGYTDFLWVLAGAFALKLPVDPAAALRGAAFVCGLALMVATPLLSRRVLSPRGWGASALVVPLIGFSTPLAVWSSAGMETSLFCLLVTSGFILSFGEGVSLAAGALLLLLASLTRPEGHFFAGMALLGVLWRRRSDGRPLLDRTLLAAAGMCVLLLAAYHGWRVWYFGGILPNTFQAKVGSGQEQYLRGIAYMRDFYRTGGSALLLLPLVLLVSRRRDRRVLLLLVTIVLYLLYVVFVGGDSMVASRFVVPVLPLWFCLVAVALEDVAGAVSVRGGSPLLPAALATALVAAMVSLSLRTGDAPYVDEVHRRAEAVRRWARVGRWMGENLPQGTHLALGAVGAIPFYSGFETTDIFGLTDPVIAGTPSGEIGRGLAGHERSNVGRVLARRPDFILSYVVLTDAPLDERGLGLLFRGSPAERDLWVSEEVRALYRPAALDLGEGYLNLLARRPKARGR